MKSKTSEMGWSECATPHTLYTQTHRIYIIHIIKCTNGYHIIYLFLVAHIQALYLIKKCESYVRYPCVSRTHCHSGM